VRLTLESLPGIVAVIVILCWFAFAGIFVFRKQPPSPPDQKRDRNSILGLALQGLSFAIVWGIRREAFTPFTTVNRFMEIAAGVLAISVAIGSVLLITAAIKYLGKEWSLTARLVEGHKLATGGPYAYVRHPIYSGMLGMLLASGVAFSNSKALFAALVVFSGGTLIRVRSEERLLRDAFDQEFDDYARRVSAIIPGVF
jgi:protein-S-isoprenylcysteine O-methyltransferase Ste14